VRQDPLNDRLIRVVLSTAVARRSSMRFRPAAPALTCGNAGQSAPRRMSAEPFVDPSAHTQTVGVPSLWE
jgi:hypothetical protein